MQCTEWNPTLEKILSRRNLPKDWGASGEIPMYSSMWKALIRPQSISGCVRSAARNSFCEGAEANTTFTSRLRESSAQRWAATSRAAVSPSSARVSARLTFNRPFVNSVIM